MVYPMYRVILSLTHMRVGGNGLKPMPPTTQLSPESRQAIDTKQGAQRFQR